MKKLFRCLSKLYVSPLTTIIVALALFSGRFRPLFTFMIATTIHELGHIIMAKIVKVNIKKISFLPFGLYAEMDDLNQVSVLKEVLVVIAGPMMYFVIYAFFKLLYVNDYISYITYQQAIAANMVILLFNLIPMYPLDGGRLLAICLSFFLPMKKVYYLMFYSSFIILIAIIYFNLANPQYLLIGYLLVVQLHFYLTIHLRWIAFLIARLKGNPNKKIIFHEKMDIYRPYDNYFKVARRIYDEPAGINLILGKSKRLAKKR